MAGNQGADGIEARKEDAVEFGPVGPRRKTEQLTLLPWSCGFTEGGGADMGKLEVRERSWFGGENHKYGLKLMNE